MPEESSNERAKAWHIAVARRGILGESGHPMEDTVSLVTEEGTRTRPVNLRCPTTSMVLGCQTVTALIRQSNRIRHNPESLKKPKGVMLRKPNKLHYTPVKFYCVIGVLNCLGTVCEKTVGDILSELSEIGHVLHAGQMQYR